MGKRPAEEIADGNHAYLKRQKIGQAASPADEIRSARQLRQILAFDQDATKTKHALQAFKAFLDKFSTTEGDNAVRISILKEYFESQAPANGTDKDAVFLSDLMQIWSFAAQSNDESLLSAIPAVLALLLRTISNFLDLSQYGLAIGRTILQKQQAQLITRGLTANKAKGFLISPVLRVLREVSLFDGGLLAKQVFYKRDHTFKGLARNLTLRYEGTGVGDLKKPSVRTNAMRYLLSMIKHLPADSKRELLNQRDIISAITRDIRDDPPFLVRDIIETLKVHILLDDGLPREAKTKIINSTSLERIASLYRYSQVDADLSPGTKTVDTIAHEFLILASTSHESGILLRQSGFYPRSIDAEDVSDLGLEGPTVDLGLDSIEWMGKFVAKVPVRNTILSDFLQNLRPWSNGKQRDLLTSVLRVAPELIADYYFGKKDFSFEPKLTATWIGYSALIYSTLELPVPEFFGHPDRYARLPPPPNIVLESVLPQPLTQKALGRCFTQPHNPMVTFVATRILCLAFEKLQIILNMYQNAAKESSGRLWTLAADQLTGIFCLRCPSAKDIILAFRRMVTNDLMQKEALAKLLMLYYRIIPRVALDAKFGVSLALADNLNALNNLTLDKEDRLLRMLELEHLSHFAHASSGMRWFHKVEGASSSPFMGLLMLAAKASTYSSSLRLSPVLCSIAAENQIFQTQTDLSALETFVMRLEKVDGKSALSSLYGFIDDCISRCSAKPIKYLYVLEELSVKLSLPEKTPVVSLLTLAMVEQWPYLIGSTDETTLEGLSHFLAEWLSASLLIGENEHVLRDLMSGVVSQLPEGSPAHTIISQVPQPIDSIALPSQKILDVLPTRTVSSNPATERADALAAMDHHSESFDTDHTALVRWTTKQIDEVIEDGHAKSLICLLSSEHLSVRKEALTNVTKLSVKLKASSLEEKEQIWLLLCETAETAKKIVELEPMPSFITAFASNAIAVLRDPLHVLYSKLNKFLAKGPVWPTDQLPLMHKIMDEKPTLDDAHHLEVNWLLVYMLSGLRTSADMAIYRRRVVFEKLLTIYNSKYLRSSSRHLITRIIFRATTIEGGSTTLVTRFSTMSWLQAQVALGDGASAQVLMGKILESYDQDRVRNWKRGLKQT